jgi:hypothetical protein
MKPQIKFIKSREVFINNKKRCIYTKPNDTKEYVKNNKKFILLSRYIKLNSKNLIKFGGVRNIITPSQSSQPSQPSQRSPRSPPTEDPTSRGRVLTQTADSRSSRSSRSRSPSSPSSPCVKELVRNYEERRDQDKDEWIWVDQWGILCGGGKKKKSIKKVK